MYGVCFVVVVVFFLFEMIRERENDLVLCVCIVVTTLEYCNFEVAFCGEISLFGGCCM